MNDSSSESILVDNFFTDNMLTEDDLEMQLELDPSLWSDVSYDSNDSSIIESSIIYSQNYSNDNSKFRMTPPDTPPSSDRSTPPDLIEINNLNSNLFTSYKPIAPKNPNDFITIIPHQIVPSINTATTQLSPLSLPNTNVISPGSSISKQDSLAKRKFIAEQLQDCNTTANRMQISQLKKEARKLRNRQASIESRKRKQNYVENLQIQVNILQKQNNDLKSENEQLKLKMELIEKENEFLKRSVFQDKRNHLIKPMNGNRKATLSLLAVILMLGFNLAPFTGMLTTGNNEPKIKSSKVEVIKHGTGRTLLWVNDTQQQGINSSTNRIEQLFANFTNLLSDKKGQTNRSIEDQCVYEYAKSAVNCLLHGEALNKSNLLACVVEQTLARNTTENNARRNQRKYLFRLFFSNRPAVRGLQSLLFHRNYLSRKITNNNEISVFNGPDSEEYQLLLERFKYLFCWPDYLFTIERNDLKHRIVPVQYAKSLAFENSTTYLNITKPYSSQTHNGKNLRTNLTFRENEIQNNSSDKFKNLTFNG